MNDIVKTYLKCTRENIIYQKKLKNEDPRVVPFTSNIDKSKIAEKVLAATLRQVIHGRACVIDLLLLFAGLHFHLLTNVPFTALDPCMYKFKLVLFEHLGTTTKDYMKKIYEHLLEIENFRDY